MARSITPALEAATLSEWVKPLILVEMLFASGPVRMWSGYGDFTWNGKTFTGTGTLMGISAIEESQEVRANGVKISLSGVPSDVISLALGEGYQGKRCSIFVAALNTNTNALIADPYEVFRGTMDVMGIDDGQEAAVISVAVESRLVDLERPRERRYDHQDQQITAPGDKFFEFVPSIQDIEIKWGRG